MKEQGNVSEGRIGLDVNVVDILPGTWKNVVAVLFFVE
jgi:hypothetical protein